MSSARFLDSRPSATFAPTKGFQIRASNVVGAASSGEVGISGQRRNALSDSLLVRNGSVITADRAIGQVDVLIENGRISDVGMGFACDNVIDADGAYVLPGIVDLHTHGIGEVSAGDESLAEFAAGGRSYGATTFYPTLFAPPDQLVAQMERHRRETDELLLTPQVGGFRLESPYLAKTGAGISKDLAEIDSDLTARLIEAGGGHIRIWDVSPELPGAVELIGKLTAQGIVCSIAHTRCSIDQARAAVEAGARLVTHLFDTFVLPEVTEEGAYPAGLVDYLLIEDRLTCEIIGDGTHVDPILVEKALRCKTRDRIAFVTDSNRGAGLPPGRYSLGEWGEIVVNGPNDGLRLADRDMVLAGSALTPIDGLRNCVRLFGQDLSKAVQLCCRTPAQLMGLNRGEIAPGRDADIIILSPELELLHTICRGNLLS